MTRIFVSVAIFLIGLSCIGSGSFGYAQTRSVPREQTAPPSDLYQLREPRFFFDGRFVNPKDLPKGPRIFVAGATKEKDVVYVFTRDEDLLRWAEQTEHAAVLTRAIEELKKQRIQRNQKQTTKQTGGPAPLPLGVGWLYKNYSYSGTNAPFVSYPKLSWVNLNNKVSSVWVVGFGVLCDYQWYGGSKAFLFAIGIPNLSVLNFDDRASSSWS